MDVLDLGDMGSGCEDDNCNFTSRFLQSCSNQDCQWEEPMFGIIELVCVTLIYIPLMLFGLLGNVLTILVVWLRPHMRSSTYLYLSSMAVSDLLILLLLPLDLYKLWRPRPWPLGDLVCKLTMFLSECCTFCTILHITFLSLERYLAVCWPITAKTLVTRRRTRTIIGCLWLCAVVSAAPVLVMVGVEEVGGEELVLGGWRESQEWTSSEGEQGGLLGGREIHIAQKKDEGERINWEEREKREWDERAGELKGFGEKGERKQVIGERDERKQGDEGGGGEEGMEDEGERRNKMKEDEGGGRGEDVGGGQAGVIDNRECRCTHYAVSSGLLSAMMILSNLYFLVPLCILGLVYSLIGRTLWLRPQSSRRDQSHRHTVKMLGVIVLAFVLCWLPFHVGRTIFFFSMESDILETYTDTHQPLDINKASNASVNTGINTHADVMAHTTDTDTQPDDISTANRHVYSHIVSHALGQHINTDANAHNRRHVETDALAEMHAHDTTNSSAYSGNVKTSFHGDTHASCSIGTPNHTHHAVTPTVPQNHTREGVSPVDGAREHADAHYFFYYLSQYFNLASSVLFYLSAAVNPLLYNLMSARYRHAVRSLAHAHSRAHTHRLPTLTAQQSTTTM